MREMSGRDDAPPWLVVPVADLLADLWHWPGDSEFLDIYVARPLLAAIAAQAAFKPTEIGGYLLGRRYIVRDPEGRDRHAIIIVNSYKVEAATSGGEEFNFGQGSRAKDLKGITEVPELRDLEVVGWYHSHHNRGAFLSPSVDQPLHRRYFPEPYQVAYVLDMLRRQAGFFIWEGPELLAGPGQCLASFDPTTLEVKSRRVGRRRKTNPVLQQIRTTWKNDSTRDGLVALCALLIGLAAFVWAFGNRPFLAWTAPGTQELRWEFTAGKVAGWAVYRTNSFAARPAAGSPFATKTPEDRTLDLRGTDRRLVAPADRGKRYWYRVAAVDEAGRPLRWSRPVPLVVPLDRPPRSPEGKVEVRDTRNAVSLKLAPYGGEDALGYWVLREGPLITREMAVLGDGKPVMTTLARVRIDDSPKDPGAYRYVAIPQDWSGNLGHPWDSAALALAGRGKGFLGLF